MFAFCCHGFSHLVVFPASLPAKLAPVAGGGQLFWLLGQEEESGCSCSYQPFRSWICEEVIVFPLS